MEKITENLVKNYLEKQDNEAMMDLKESIDYALYIISNQKNLQINDQLAFLTQFNYELGKSINNGK